MIRKLALVGAGLTFLALLTGCAPAAPTPTKTLEPLVPVPKAVVSEEDAEFFALLERSAPVMLKTEELKAEAVANAHSTCDLLDYIDGTMAQVFALIEGSDFEYEKSQIVGAGIRAYCPQHLFELKEWTDSQK